MAQPNVPSALITDQENETLFTLIGGRKQSKATAVVQMFHANADSRSEWTKFKTGVVCFVKDNPKKSYYIRLYDLAAKSMVYEQEIYNQFTYSKDRSFFHSFPADKIMVGLNFASEDEANKFYAAVTTKLEERERRATIKRSKEGSGNHSSSSVGMNQPQMIKAPINAVDSGADHSNPFSGSSKKLKPRKPKGKISKSDIGAPSDFRHLSHVGYDPSTGNFDSSNINPDWKQLLDTVGVTNEDLKNKDTATFIYDFVEKHGGIQEATKQLREASSNAAPPPPPPGRRGGGGRDLPAPPSKNRGAPPPPPPSRSGAPPPPPPAGGGPAPPPPPPPPPIGGPAPPPPPPVRAGGGSSPPPRREKSNSNLPAVSDSRSDLLASIRKGTQLKRVTDEGPSSSSSPPPEPGLDGMAGALMRALAQRKTALKNSDSESETDSVVNDDDFDWSD